MKLQHYFLMLFCIVAFAKNSKAQTIPALTAGIKIMAEANSGSGSTMPFGGLQLVYQKNKHASLETGLYYRPVKSDIIISYYDPNSNFSYTGFGVLSERFLHLPVLYRYQSKIINFSVGPSLDLFLGWKDKSDKNIVTINSYSRSANILIGGVAAISKTINLAPDLILEPEIRFNPIISNNDPYTHSAFGFAFRYKLK